MKRKILSQLRIGMACVFLLGLTSCAPHEITVNDYINVAKNATGGESLEAPVQISTDCYTFKSSQRDLEFKVWTTPDEVVMNGTNYGYSGDVSFYDDYADVLHSYYEEDILKLFEESGFEVLSRSAEYQYTESISVIIKASMTDEDKELFNQLMDGIQEITNSEQKYHREGLVVVLYSLQVWIEDNGNYYLTSYYNPGEKAAQTEVYVEGGNKALTVNSFKKTDAAGVTEVAVADQNGIVLQFSSKNS